MKRAVPSALIRAGIAASLGLASAVLMPIACGVDTLPPAPPRAATSSTGGGGTGGAGGSSGGSTGAGAGPANVCACATEAFTIGSACSDCFHQMAGIDCASAVTACYDDASCLAILSALASCDAGAQCVATTLATHPGRNAYLDVLACVCASCAQECAGPSTVKCDAVKIPVEAGSDADPDAEAGSDASDDAMLDAADDAMLDATMDAMDAGDDAAMDAADGGD